MTNQEFTQLIKERWEVDLDTGEITVVTPEGKRALGLLYGDTPEVFKSRAQLITEAPRLQATVELLEKEMDTRNYACGDALDKLWKDVILAYRPNYGDWEYPGQAYNHIVMEMESLRKRIAELEGMQS